MGAATAEQIAGYKAEAQSVPQPDGTVRYYTIAGYFVGTRLTDCCAAASTYMDDGTGGQELTCKACYQTVPVRQGDGGEILNADGTVTSYGDTSFCISFDEITNQGESK